MDPIPTVSISAYRRDLSSSDNPSVTPYLSPSASTAIAFASVFMLLIMLGLCCSLMRRRPISRVRHRLVQQLRESMPGILMRRPANVSLPVRKYTKEWFAGDVKETDDCPVCLVEFEEGEEVKVVVPGCEHVFHPVCIDRWLAMRDTCPVCRLAVVADEATNGGEGEDGEVEVIVASDRVEGEEEGEGSVEVELNVESDGGERGEGEVRVNVEREVVNGGEGGGGEGGGGVHVGRNDGEGREGEVEVEVNEGERGEEELEVNGGERGEEELEVNVESLVEVIEGRAEEMEREREREEVHST